MASELIKAILETEKECREKEADAKAQAEIKKQEALKKAREIVENAEQQTSKMLKDDKQAISASSKRQLEKEKQKTKKECDECGDYDLSKLKMKAVRIIALKSDRKRLLEHLQDSALIHVKHDDEVQEGFARADTSAQLKQFEKNAETTEKALKILGNVAPEKKGLLESFKGRREIDADEIGDIAFQAAKIMGICGKICRIDDQITDNIAEQAQYDEQLLSETLAGKCPELIFELEVVYSSSNMTSIVVFTPKSQKEKAELTLRSIGFSRPLNPTSKIPLDKAKRLAKKSNDLKDKNEELKEQIANYADYREAIRDTQDYFELRAEKYRVISELDQTEHVFVLNGYIPEEDCGKLEEICKKVQSAVVEFYEAGDDAPVKLKNNAFAEPAQSIVTMYASPSKEDIDPTPVLAFFFYFFFGMMFSDAACVRKFLW